MLSLRACARMLLTGVRPGTSVLPTTCRNVSPGLGSAKAVMLEHFKLRHYQHVGSVDFRRFFEKHNPNGDYNHNGIPNLDGSMDEVTAEELKIFTRPLNLRSI